MTTLWRHRYAQRTVHMKSSAIRELLKLTAQPGVISFAGGLPAPEQKVAFVPGSAFHPLGGGGNTMRLNFSNATDTMIEDGIARLGRVVTRHLEAAAPRPPDAHGSVAPGADPGDPSRLPRAAGGRSDVETVAVAGPRTDADRRVTTPGPAQWR